MNPAPATMENQRSFLDRDLPTSLPLALQLTHSWGENVRERSGSHLPLLQVTLAAPPGTVHQSTARTHRELLDDGAFPEQGSAQGVFPVIHSKERQSETHRGQVSNGPEERGDAAAKGSGV